jgi:hypothetical protein
MVWIKGRNESEKRLMAHLHPIVEERDGRYYTGMQHGIDFTKKIAYFKKHLNELYEYKYPDEKT